MRGPEDTRTRQCGLCRGPRAETTKGQRRPRRYQDKVHSEEERGRAESLGVGTLGCQKVLGQAGTHGTAMTGSWCPPTRLQEVVSFLQDMEQQLFEEGGGLLSE